MANQVIAAATDATAAETSNEVLPLVEAGAGAGALGALVATSGALVALGALVDPGALVDFGALVDPGALVDFNCLTFLASV